MITNGQRALAHIEKIVAVTPIEGADNIEMVQVLGWNCIAKKGEFNVGDLAVYIEIDSKVPENHPAFEFLASKHYKIKTMKLGKFTFNGGACVSQGIALPVTLFPEIEKPEENTDVTELLKITYASEEDKKRKSSNNNAKYISMAARHKKLFSKKPFKWLMKRKWGKELLFFFFGKKKDKPRAFPNFISKTDEERIENQPWRLEDNTVSWVALEKLDGTSSSYAMKRVKGKGLFSKPTTEFYVCSRNIRQQDENQACYHDRNVYWDMAFKYNIEKVLKDILDNNSELEWVAIQGETVGSVQGNPLKLKEDDFYAFNFIDSKNGRWGSIEAKDYLSAYGIKWVPVLGIVNLPNNMKEMKEFANGKSALNPNVLREGIVYRSLDGVQSFKNVDPIYLLKHNG